MINEDERFEWTESDSKWSVYETTNERDFDAIYGFDCPDCGEQVWSDGCDMDPDGPTWYFECSDCELRFSMYVSSVTVTASESGI